MQDSAPVKRMSGLKIFGIIVGVLVVLAVITVFWMKVVADRKRGQMDRENKAEIARIRGRSGARPVLSGAAEPGNAWDDYDKALTEFKLTAAGMKLGVILDPKREDKPDGAQAQLPQFAPAIAHLRRGARRAESKKDYEWEKGGAMSTPPLGACHQICSFALLQARVLTKEGKTGDAVEEILDVLQFGRDLAEDGPIITHMIGMASAIAALQEAKDLVASGALDHAARETLERGLRATLTAFPSFEDACTREIQFSASLLLQEAGQNFLVALVYLNITEQMRDWALRNAAASRVSWAEAQKVDAEVQVEVQKSWNFIAKIASPSHVGTGGKASRRWLAQTRLLLAAVHCQDTGEVLDLDDPFSGARLKSSKTGDAIKVWSSGPDGVDDGGSGGWGPNDGRDIVLEVPRK